MAKKRTLNTFQGKFICGDCEAILKTMPDSSIDLVLTSPPYADKRDYGDVDGTIPQTNMSTGSFQKQKKSTVSSRRTAASF